MTFHNIWQIKGSMTYFQPHPRLYIFLNKYVGHIKGILQLDILSKPFHTMFLFYPHFFELAPNVDRHTKSLVSYLDCMRRLKMQPCCVWNKWRGTKNNFADGASFFLCEYIELNFISVCASFDAHHAYDWIKATRTKCARDAQRPDMSGFMAAAA